MASNNIKYNQKYEHIVDIGCGSFGKAILVKDITSNVNGKPKLYVIKIIDILWLGQKERQDTINEIQVLSVLKHPYIISYKESFVEKGRICIVMEYADGGDLYKAIQRQKKKSQYFSEAQILRWVTQAILALKYIHDKLILHRDLKSQNLFLTSGGRLCIGDFGIAKLLGNTAEFAKTQVGTPYYLSPEICQNRPYTSASDIWALGCVLHELATLSVPFQATNIGLLLKKITKNEPPPFPSRYSPALAQLCLECLNRDWKKRPTANDLLQKDIIKNELKQMLLEQHQLQSKSKLAMQPRYLSATNCKAELAMKIVRPLSAKVFKLEQKPITNQDVTKQKLNTSEASTTTTTTTTSDKAETEIQKISNPQDVSQQKFVCRKVRNLRIQTKDNCLGSSKKFVGGKQEICTKKLNQYLNKTKKLDFPKQLKSQQREQCYTARESYAQKTPRTDYNLLQKNNMNMIPLTSREAPKATKPELLLYKNQDDDPKVHSLKGRIKNKNLSGNVIKESITHKNDYGEAWKHEPIHIYTPHKILHSARQSKVTSDSKSYKQLDVHKSPFTKPNADIDSHPVSPANTPRVVMPTDCPKTPSFISAAVLKEISVKDRLLDYKKVLQAKRVAFQRASKSKGNLDQTEIKLSVSKKSLRLSSKYMASYTQNNKEILRESENSIEALSQYRGCAHSEHSQIFSANSIKHQ